MRLQACNAEDPMFRLYNVGLLGVVATDYSQSACSLF